MLTWVNKRDELGYTQSKNIRELKAHSIQREESNKEWKKKKEKEGGRKGGFGRNVLETRGDLDTEKLFLVCPIIKGSFCY